MDKLPFLACFVCFFAVPHAGENLAGETVNCGCVAPPERSAGKKDRLSFLQMSRSADCGAAPEIDNKRLDNLIDGSKQGVLLVGMKRMRCTQAVLDALQQKGIDYTTHFFDSSAGPPGQPMPDDASPVWKWLHCKYPNDANMHSYLFVNGKFEGEGFTAAKKIQSGSLLATAGLLGSSASCEERFSEQAKTVSNYMEQTSNRVLLFGWQGCPCTGIAEARFAANSVCYEGRTWADPNADIMKYLQCKTGDPTHHSFIYFRSSNADSSDFTFFGNGFEMSADALPDVAFLSKISSASAKKTCKQATVAFNVYGGPLEECRLPSDGTGSGSWMDDGKCSETMGGIHQVCIQAGTLPGDFSMSTYQSSDWSKSRTQNSHCICVGAFSTYMTEEKKHIEGTEKITPRCKSIPETVLSQAYMGHWERWNGFDANVAKGLGELVKRCMTVDDAKLKCGLKTRFTSLLKQDGELAKAPELEQLRQEIGSLSCDAPMELL